ncbi:hypothetical protein B0H13DRAFT_1897433 [Mycena leptocephala]|nr:hypothetical protein B0H13DRAFT_1897433 [Mycena leptocephala]
MTIGIPRSPVTKIEHLGVSESRDIPPRWLQPNFPFRVGLFSAALSLSVVITHNWVVQLSSQPGYSRFHQCQVNPGLVLTPRVVLQRTLDIENNLALNWKIEGNHTTGRLSWRGKKARGKHYTNSEMNWWAAAAQVPAIATNTAPGEAFMDPSDEGEAFLKTTIGLEEDAGEDDAAE